jgi:hypothetical protein
MKITISSQFGENVPDKMISYKSRWFYKTVAVEVEFPNGFDQALFDKMSDWAFQQALALVQRDIKAYLAAEPVSQDFSSPTAS